MRIPPLAAEGGPAVPLAKGTDPRSLVLVRLHAFGDSVALLPVIAGLRARFPGCTLEVVAGPAAAPLFRAHEDVARVHVLDARAPRLARLAALLRVVRALRARPIDAFLDLQRSRLSRLLRLAVRPGAFAVHDRFAPRHGLQRYLDTVEACGLGPVEPRYVSRARREAAERAARLLEEAGYDPARPLVLLNPAGGWETKQWPLERWTALGRALVSSHRAQVLFLGAGEVAGRVASLARSLGSDAVDLTGRTEPDEAMACVAACAAAVSEDSGLMHLAWCQGVPTLALFGASRSVWSRPLGPRADGFYSEDLSCGACMSPACAREDLHCLMRVSVEAVAARAGALMA